MGAYSRRLARANLLPRSPLGAGSRGSVEERPLHTRKVAGSIPAGTTSYFCRLEALQPPAKNSRAWSIESNAYPAMAAPVMFFPPSANAWDSGRRGLRTGA